MSRLLLASLLLAAPAAAQDRTLRGKVLDPDGKPAAGVQLSHLWRSYKGRPFAPDAPAVTAADGTFALAVPKWKTPTPVLALTPERDRGAFAVAAGDDPLTLTLVPTLAVSGTFGCEELGRPLKDCVVYVGDPDKQRPIIEFVGEPAAFRFPLPPGKYHFNGYGSDVLGVKRPLVVPGDRSAYDLGTIDLKAAAIAKMVGKPPLAWTLKDARGLPKTVQPADLKGKWVVLDFWGHWCGPCVRELATMIDFYELHAAHRDQFEIIAVHDNSVPDFATMDAKTAGTKRSLWGGRDLPFPVLLDAGATAKAYTVSSWPTTILIDPAGNVVGETDGVKELEKKLPPLPPGVKANRALGAMLGVGTDGNDPESFCQFLANQGGVPIRLDAAAFAAKGVDPKAKTRLKMTGTVSLRSWIELTLAGTGLVVKVDGDGLLVTAGDPLPPSKVQAECARHLAAVLGRPFAVDLPATTLGGLCQYFEGLTSENFVLDPAAKLDPATAVPAFKGEGKPLAASLAAVLGPLGLVAEVRYEVIVLRPKG